MAGPTSAEALQHVHAGLIRLLDAMDIACRKQENPAVHRHLQALADALQQHLAEVADFHNGEYSEVQPLQGGTPAWQGQMMEDEAHDDAGEQGLKHCPRAVVLTKAIRRLVVGRRAQGSELEGANAVELKTLRIHLKDIANYINLKQTDHDNQVQRLQKENAALLEQLMPWDEDEEREVDRLLREWRAQEAAEAKKQVADRAAVRKALRRA
jgi:hypothetical protein